MHDRRPRRGSVAAVRPAAAGGVTRSVRPRCLPVTAIVPTHAVSADLERCLASLRASRPAPAEIVVVLDGVPHDARCLDGEADLEVVRLPQNGGPARARNVGAAAATQPILFFVDSDVTVRPDTLQRATRLLQHEPEVSAVIGSYDDEPGPANFISQYKGLLNHYVHQTGHSEASTFWGACAAIRREAFREVGGFDESWPWLEDVELGHRLRQAGHLIRLDRNMLATHHKRWSAPSLMRSDIFHRAKPWTVLIHRDHEMIDDLNLSWANRIGVLLAFLGVVSAAGVPWLPWLLPAALAFAVALVVANWPLYLFFARKRGIWFAARAIPWHWLYLLYGGATFAVVYTGCLLRKRVAWR